MDHPGPGACRGHCSSGGVGECDYPGRSTEPGIKIFFGNLPIFSGPLFWTYPSASRLYSTSIFNSGMYARNANNGSHKHLPMYKYLADPVYPSRICHPTQLLVMSRIADLGAGLDFTESDSPAATTWKSCRHRDLRVVPCLCLGEASCGSHTLTATHALYVTLALSLALQPKLQETLKSPDLFGHETSG